MDLLVNEEAHVNVVLSNTDSWVEQEKEVCTCVETLVSPGSDNLIHVHTWE